MSDFEKLKDAWDKFIDELIYKTWFGKLAIKILDKLNGVLNRI